MATKPNKSIKVSQKTIDEVKKMGMAKALKEIKSRANQGQGMGPAGKTMRQEGMKLATNSEFAEAVRRLYGDRRSAAARTTVSPTTSRGPSAAKAASKSTGGKYVGSMFVPATSPVVKTAKKTAVKKAAAPKTKPTLGGFSMAAKALGSVGGKVERTPARQAEIKALQARLKAKRDAKKNK
jgi:hypothetical protein